jgi:tetratricopeptide (TPR) repeat protein
MYLRRFGILLSLSGMLLAGCASPIKLFERAQSVESSDPAAAVKIYSRILQHPGDSDPKFLAKVHVRRGDLLLLGKDPQGAFEDYQHATAADPKNADAHLRSANLLLMANSGDRASQEATQALRLEPGNPDAMAILGIAALTGGRVAEGKSILVQVLSKRPDRVDLAVIVAELERTEGALDQARKVLMDAADAVPKDARPRLALGRMAEEQGDNASAEQNYRLAVHSDDSPEANLRLAQFLQRTTRFQESADVLAHVDALEGNKSSRVADYRLVSGQGKQAAEQYRSALGKLTVSVGTNDPKEIKSEYSALAARIIEADLQTTGGAQGREHVFPARLHLQQFASFFDPTTNEVLGSEIALVEGDLQAAMSQANSAVTISPESASAHFVLASVSERTGDRSRAKAEVDTALLKNPAFVPARLMAAEQALLDKNPDAAETHVAMVIRNEPANLSGLLLYARVLHAQKRYLTAMMMARRALAVDASSSEAHCIMGQVDKDSGNPAGAFVEYEQAVTLAPRSHEAIQGLVDVYRFGKITRPMLRKMERVANNPPRSATLMETAGRLYAEHQWYEDAERCLRAAAEIDPERAPALTALAKNYLSTGDAENAQQAIAGANRAWAEMLQGGLAMERNDVQSAIRSYEAALQHGENSGTTANNLAWIYAQQSNHLDRALQLARTAHQALPRNLGVMDTLGVVYLRRREYDQAIQILENAIELQKVEHTAGAPMADVRQHLAEAYRDSGRTSDAEALSR